MRLTEQTPPAVLLIVWRRVETTRDVWHRVLNEGARSIYVSGDGPRAGISSDRKQCDAIRALFESPPEGVSVTSRFRECNIGLQLHVVSSINWFFSQVKEGIILEDDILPTSSFFVFSAELLKKYRDSDQISQVSGAAHAPGFNAPCESSYSYDFSVFQHVWGFATWADRWSGFSDFLESRHSVSRREIVEAFPGHSEGFYRHWTRRTNGELRQEKQTWTAAWNTFCGLRGRMSVVPKAPLVSNIGLDEQATNHKREPLIAGRMGQPKELGGLLVGPNNWRPNLARDQYVAATQWPTQTLMARGLLASLEAGRRVVVKALGSGFLGRRVDDDQADQSGIREQNYLTVAQRFWLWRHRRH